MLGGGGEGRCPAAGCVDLRGGPIEGRQDFGPPLLLGELRSPRLFRFSPVPYPFPPSAAPSSPLVLSLLARGGGGEGGGGHPRSLHRHSQSPPQKANECGTELRRTWPGHELLKKERKETKTGKQSQGRTLRVLESACQMAGPSPKNCLGLRWSSLRRCPGCLRAGVGWQSLGAEAEGACCIPGALRARKPSAAAAPLPHPSWHPLPQPTVPTTTTTVALPAQGSTGFPQTR